MPAIPKLKLMANAENVMRKAISGKVAVQKVVKPCDNCEAFDYECRTCSCKSCPDFFGCGGNETCNGPPSVRKAKRRG